MKRPELLAPVGDFECLKAAVQNGADSVYLGASSFNARSSATNFNLEQLREAIQYAKLRNVKVHLTLNTLLKETELDQALELANMAYSFGVDALIVQDLGLAKLLHEYFPDLDLHASTQMTVHNLEGVKALEKLGFKRIVLSRELSIDEIKYICQHSSSEIEVFVHGALCISYSGRCYISSMIGGRSGNRGKCAQACRLPYQLYDFSNNVQDKGYLLSPRDLCSLDYLSELIEAGVACFKIEGRMKTPEYVATVTRIYRKYIDNILNGEKSITEDDKTALMQVFNRGGFSSGHLDNTANRKLIYPVKPNHMGLYLGKVQKVQDKKAYINLEPQEEIEIGDKISFEKENTKYTISEIIYKNQNVRKAYRQTVQIGRMKGNIHVGDKIYKLESKSLTQDAQNSYANENKKIELDCKIIVHKGQPISMHISTVASPTTDSIYDNLSCSVVSSCVPETATNSPITAQRIENQIRKTGNTPFVFRKITIDLEEGLYIPSISQLNELRRNALSQIEELAIQSFRKAELSIPRVTKTFVEKPNSKKQISLLLNKLKLEENYSKLEEVDYIYIPLKYYLAPTYSHIIKQLPASFIYFPSIIRQKQKESLAKSIEKIMQTFSIKGFVISNLSELEWLPKKENLQIIANYTFNVCNTQTLELLTAMGVTRITASPELSKESSQILSNSNLESIVYGRLPVMTLNYCLLGKSNHCYATCNQACKKGSYFLRDRMKLDFPILPDNTQTITTIYNSKISSILPSQTPASTYRIDILEEKIEDINNIIKAVREDKRQEGKDYTNANQNREI